MKKRKYFVVILLSTFIVFGAFKQQHFFARDEISSELDSIKLQDPIKKPLEIAGVIEKFDSLISLELKKSGAVGGAVAITYKNQIAYQKCFGVQRAGTKDSINKNTIFRLASVSKTVTGVLAGILSDEKTIDLDDKVVNYLPDFRLKNKTHTNLLSVRNLLSHTTGVVPHAYDDLVEHHVPLKTIISRFDRAGETSEPGRIYAYQNVLFSLIDTILRVKTSKSYAEFAEEKLFQPYGMYDASTDFESFKQSKNKAYPHSAIAKGKYAPTRLNDRYYSTAPAAGVNASISDMTNFLLALSNENDNTLNETVHKTVFSPQVRSPLSWRYFRRWDRVDSKHYGIGWRLIGYKGRQVAYHGGYVHGYKTGIAFCKDDDIGIVFLSNSPNSASSSIIPTFLNLIFEYNDNRSILTNTEVKSSQPKNSKG